MAAPMLENVLEKHAVIRQEIDDENFHCIENVIHTTGRGRRPSLPNIGFTNLLLLQLFFIKTEGNVTWDAVQEFSIKHWPYFKTKSIRTLIEQSICDASKLETIEARSNFYKQIINLDFKFVGKSLQALGLSTLYLNDMDLLKKMFTEPIVITNEILIDLEFYRTKHSYPHCWLHDCLQILLNFKLTTSDVQKIKTKVLKAYRSKIKSKNKTKQNNEDFLLYLNTICDFGTSNTNDSESVMQESSDSCNINDISTQHCIYSEKLVDVIPLILENDLPSSSAPSSTSDMRLIISKYAVQLQTLNRKFASLEEEKNKIQVCLEVSADQCQDKNKKVELLSANIVMKDKINISLEKELKTVKEKNDNLECELASLRKAHSSIKGSNYYKKLQRLETDLEKDKLLAKQHEDEGCAIKIENLQKQLKYVQTTLCKNKDAVANIKLSKKKLQDLIQDLEQKLGIVEAELLEFTSKRVQTRTGFHFSTDVIKTVIELMGETEVSADKCAKIIHTVSKHMHHINIPLSDLPSERTSLRFCDRGHVLAKYHIADAIDKCDHFDLHSDGTTKDHRKYVGHQLTLNTGESLSTGFVPVCHEDAQTLLEIAIQLLQELSDIYEDDAEQHYQTMLRKLVGLMSDRASVMKSFDKKFDYYRKEVLQTEESIEFLHCNAHFLLGLSSESDKIIKQLQSEINEKLGRDKSAAFNRFGNSAETSAGRYIRMGCSSLGPRGDEKSGCRDSWEAFCELQGQKSFITSFRSNRFNNFFQGAVGLHFHRDKILNFFAEYHTNNNLKLQSIAADAQSEEIDSFMTALGILYHKVTGPYWKLVKSEVPYLEFYMYVEKMSTAFKAWSDNASPLLDKDEVLFEDFAVPCDVVLQSLYEEMPNPPQPTLSVKNILQKLVAGFLVVVQRQLDDFLPGGKYHGVHDTVRKEKMAHCKLTNLLGEACFGDLDFSLFKRRNSSLHHHSTINMMKRNQTMSTWFAQKPVEDQQRLLDRSACLAPSLREKHKLKVKQVQQQMIQSLLDSKEILEKKQKLREQQKEELVRAVRDHGGPCLSAIDVDNLISKYKFLNEKSVVLKDEIRYQKTVLGHKDKILRLTGSVPALLKNLKTFLCGRDPTDNLPELILNTATSDDATSNVDSDDDIDTISDQVDIDSETFQFATQGMWVSVYYDNTFYIGKVISIINEKVASVQFMENCSVRAETFRWPRYDDIDNVEARFVFSWNFEVKTSNGTGRIWTVPEIKKLKLQYQKFVEQFS